MIILSRTLVRAGIVGGLAALAAGGTASHAHARSADLNYTCRVSVPGSAEAVELPLVARLDSPVPDDGKTVQRAGSTIVLHPFRGTLVLAEPIVDQIRDAGNDALSGSGTLNAYVRGAQSDTITEVDLRYPPRPLPDSGPMLVALENDDRSIATNARPGLNLLVAPTFTGRLSDPDPDTGGDAVSFACEIQDGPDIAFDQLTGTVAPRPPATAEPSTTASAVRPDLVQTDAPDDEGTPALPTALLGAGALTVAALVRRLCATDTSRRH